MDSFDDQNFGHILRDLGSSRETKEHFNSSVYPQGVEDENVDVSDLKILTPLEIPKSKSQFNFCKSLTEKLKNDESAEFSLTEMEPGELNKPLFTEMKNKSYFVPNTAPTALLPTETLSIVPESKLHEDQARQEILACLSDLPTPPAENCTNNAEENVGQPENKLDNTTVVQDEAKTTHSKIHQQKLKSANSSSATKRKAEDSSIHEEAVKQRASKNDTCMYFPGMIVWAKITGYSYWPAMIDHDPDCNAFTWPNDSSPITHHHVVFFDTNGRLSRSWVKLHYLKPFTEVVKISSSRPKDYIERFKRSVKEAKEAMNLSLEQRLKKYSFKERLKLPGTKLCQD